MTSPQQRDWQTAAPDLTGRRLGDYQILRKLGRGGMAEVYLAQQLSLHRPVALKVLLPAFAGNENYVRRFLQEARAAAGLVHANIVQIHEVGRQDGVQFIAQEYVAGKNLKQLLQTRSQPLGAAEGVHLLRQVAAALQKAAEQQIVHRDIKPENILLTPAGEAKVADFGLARVASVGADQTSLTEVGVTMGTPLYMSPEQVEGKPVDPRSDLYSLGVTAYHMFAGKPPFEGETQLAIAVQHLNAAPRPLEAFRPDLPRELCGIVARLMAKAPGERFASASELLGSLRQLGLGPAGDDWLADLKPQSGAFPATSIAAATQQLSLVLKQQPAQPPRWSRSVATAAAWVLVALVLGGLAAWARRPPSLLAQPKQSRKVERLESIDRQSYFALMSNTVEAWQAVEEYFPPNGDPNRLRQIRVAKRRLAGLYLERNELNQAFQLYSELASLEDTEVQFRRLGLAGQAVVYDLRGKSDDAKKLLAQLLDPQGRLPPLEDPVLAGRLANLRQRYFPTAVDAPSSAGPTSTSPASTRPAPQ